MDAASASSRANVMGQLRSQVEKHGRKRLSGYKKRFWVVNFHTKRLEVYKNDQSHEPANQWRAEDIRGVIYAGDKQNRFYAMIVQTRLGHTIKFRMSSLEERAKWSRAITQLIDAFSMSHRRNNIFEFLQRRTRAVGRSLNISIAVDWPRLLTVSQEMLEYTVEALDSALASVASLVRDYGAEFPVPQNYTLNVQTQEAPLDDVDNFPGPQYDPIRKSAVLNVVLYKDGLNHVKFFVTEPEEVIHIMQSNVFRNPLIEGWIATSPGCAETCDEIRALLDMSASQLPITFQWGQHLSDSGRVERYLQEFVNEGFFRGVLSAVKETLRDVERMLEDLLKMPASVQPSPAPTPRAGATATGSEKDHASPLTHRLGSAHSLGAHGRSFSAALFLPALDASGASTGAGGGGRPSSPSVAARAPQWDHGPTDTTSNAAFTARRSTWFVSHGALSPVVASEMQAFAVKLLANNITGLAIQLDKRVIDEGKRPPLVVVEHTMEYESRGRPAFLLVAKYSQIYEHQCPSRDTASLHDQLFEVAFHAILSKQISSLRSRLSAVFENKVGVAIMWDRLLQVFHKLHATLFLRDLPKLVSALADVYLPRMHHTVQLMSSVRANHDIFAVGSSRRVSGAGPAANSSMGHNANTDGVAAALAATGGGGGGDNPERHATAGGGPDAFIEEAELTVFDVFTQCVGTVVIDFFSFAELIELKGGNPHKPSLSVVAAAVPEPALVNGNLTDAILCADDATVAAMLSAVNQVRDATSRHAPMLVRNVFAYAATPRMGMWCEKFFSSPERVAACTAAPRKVIEDEFASDSDAGTAEPALDLGDGEAVANERRAEIAVLNMKRVVNTIYDSQGESIDLKISAQEIRTAIRSLQTAFKAKRVTKHDIMRVLTINLRRLRGMYSLATDGEANTFLTRAKATQLLSDFCEFEETEHHVAEALQRYATESHRTQPPSTLLRRTEPAPESSAQPQPPAQGRRSDARRESAGSLDTVPPMDGNRSKETSRHPNTSNASAGNNSISSPNVSPSLNRSNNTFAEDAGLSPLSQKLAWRRATVVPSELLTSAPATATVPPAQLDPSRLSASESAEAPLRAQETDLYVSSARRRAAAHPGRDSAANAKGAHGAAGAGKTETGKHTPPSDAVGGSSDSLVDVSASSTTPRSGRHVPVPALDLPNSVFSISGIIAPFHGPSRGAGDSQHDVSAHASPVAAASSTVLAKSRTNAFDGPDDDAGNGGSGGGDGGCLYDFQTFCSIALNELLPREAVTARRAWRTGFVFGLENAGKSHIVNSIRCFPRPTVATVGLSRHVVAFDEWVFSLNELGGRDSFRKNWQFYAKRMEKVHFLLHVVDCSAMSLYEESIKYLKEVVRHFKSEPMVIVFNNYQATPKPKDLETLEWEYEVDKIRKLNPRRSLFICTHELSLAHPVPKHTPMPPMLHSTMRRLSDALFDATPPDEQPTMPKDAGRDSQTLHRQNTANSSNATGSVAGGRGSPGPSTQQLGGPRQQSVFDRAELWRDASSFMFEYERPRGVEAAASGRRGAG